MSEADGYRALERFDNVDATNEQRMFFAFLDRVERLPDVTRRRQRSCDLLRLEPGRSVADVGCGLGTATRELAARVGSGGHATGIDLSAAMVAEASRRARATQLPVTFEQASAENLPFTTASLQAYRAERLYQHLPDVSKALAEARRVLAQGGRILLIDQDWDLALLDADDVGTGREIHRAFCDSMVQGSVGRRFRGFLLGAGFADVHVEADTLTTSNGEDYGFVVDIFARTASGAGMETGRVQAWVADQQRRIAEDRFLLVMTHFIASATQPPGPSD